MSRVLGLLAAMLVAGWAVAHLLYLGPVRDAAELTLTWALVLTAASGLVASTTVLVFGLLVGGTSPGWLRFVQVARTGAAVIGSALVVVGLLHYRDTEPRGELQWTVLGLVVLAGAGLVHWWLTRLQRQALS